MALKPIVRYMILCDDWETDPIKARSINILGLLSNIHPLELNSVTIEVSHDFASK